MANDKTAVRCGSTNKPKRRKNEYSHHGQNGTMHYAKTDDMKTDENKLLGLKDWRDNMHQRSNGQNKSGYIYIICETDIFN